MIEDYWIKDGYCAGDKELREAGASDRSDRTLFLRNVAEAGGVYQG